MEYATDTSTLTCGMARLAPTDPEFAERFSYFAGEEVPGEPTAELPARERYLAILAVLLGCQGAEQFRLTLAEALDAKTVTPVEAREVVYQGTAYLGIGRTRPFFSAMNEVFARKGVELPLPAQATTTLETRGAAGNQKQIDYFGEHMRENWKTGPAERANVNLWLAENCFARTSTARWSRSATSWHRAAASRRPPRTPGPTSTLGVRRTSSTAWSCRSCPTSATRAV